MGMNVTTKDLTGPLEPVQGLTKEEWPKSITVTKEQSETLQRILERDWTAWESHGGLRGLLGISSDDVKHLHELVLALK